MSGPRDPAVPYSSTRCYACDASATGARDRRREGGLVEAACARHADTAIRAFAACCYCGGPRPSLVVDGVLAHESCHSAAEE